MTERFFKLEDLPPDTRIRNNIFPSLLFPANASIRAGDLQLKVVSTNDKRDTVTLELVGVFVKPKEQPEETNSPTLGSADTSPNAPDQRPVATTQKDTNAK